MGGGPVPAALSRIAAFAAPKAALAALIIVFPTEPNA